MSVVAEEELPRRATNARDAHKDASCQASQGPWQPQVYQVMPVDDLDPDDAEEAEGGQARPDARARQAAATPNGVRAASLPSWVAESAPYDPPHDRDSFVERSLLSITSVLDRFRLDDGQEGRLSPSAPVKMAVALVLILLTSLSHNFAFVVLMLACVLARVAALPADKLKRVAGVAATAAGLTALLMLPAVLIGQAHSALLVGTKVLVTLGIAMTVAVTTPFNRMTAALRAAHVPSVFIMTVDMALHSIVSLGRVAEEATTALKVRSIGVNRQKGGSLGGVAGVVLLKGKRDAETVYDAMACRGFEGDYPTGAGLGLRKADAAWLVACALVVAAFVYLQGLV